MALDPLDVPVRFALAVRLRAAVLRRFTRRFLFSLARGDQAHAKGRRNQDRKQQQDRLEFPARRQNDRCLLYTSSTPS